MRDSSLKSSCSTFASPLSIPFALRVRSETLSAFWLTVVAFFETNHVRGSRLFMEYSLTRRSHIPRYVYLSITIYKAVHSSWTRRSSTFLFLFSAGDSDAGEKKERVKRRIFFFFLLFLLAGTYLITFGSVVGSSKEGHHYLPLSLYLFVCIYTYIYYNQVFRESSTFLFCLKNYFYSVRVCMYRFILLAD